jgi:hypothetical protein
MTKIKLDDYDKAKAITSLLKLLPWAENTLNGKMVGKNVVMPVYFQGNKFNLTLEPKTFTDEVAKKYGLSKKAIK